MLTQFAIEPDRLRAWGEQAVLEVESPRRGVIRIRHVPLGHLAAPLFPRLREKRSFAVLEALRLPLEVVETAAELRVRADGIGLAIDRSSGAWRVEADGAGAWRCRRFAGEARVGYPEPAWRSVLELEARPGEAFLGLGERLGPLDRRGRRLTFWNTDVMPHHPDTDPLYVAIPFLLSLHRGLAWGAFLDEPWRSELDLGLADPEAVRWESSGPELDLYLFAGPRPEDVLEAYTALTGRAPLPPLWALGAHQSRWGYDSAEEVEAVIDGYRQRDLPLDCVHLDLDHMEGFASLTWDAARFPDPPGLMRAAHERGVKVVTIVDPALRAEPGQRLYDEAVKQNLLVRSARGDVLLGTVWPRPAAWPDFTQRRVQRWWADAHREFLQSGVDGIWNDMNEPSCFELSPQPKPLDPPTVPRGLPDRVEGPTLPFDAQHGERRHVEVHNVYGHCMSRAAFEGCLRHRPGRRPFVLTRSGYAGIQRWGAVWTGDNSSLWSHLELSIAELGGLGMSGVPLVGADVPGFLGRADGELLVRWLQLGAFYPLLRNHSARGTAPQEPWRFGEPWLSLAREALRRRYRLLPLLYTLMHEAHETGLPPLRPLALHHPEDREALWANDELLFGRDLLVAPVVRQGARTRLAWLPEGRWLRFADLQHGGEVETGSRHVIAPAPLEVAPVWLREGAAIPLTEPALHTTTAGWRALAWHVHPGAAFRGTLYEDAGDGEGPSRLTVIRGGRDAHGWTVERSAEGGFAPEREHEALVLHGLAAPSRVEGARAVHHDGEALHLELDPEWSRITIR